MHSSKPSLREAALRRRQALSEQERTALSHDCCRHLSEYIQTLGEKPLSVAFYAATRSELDTDKALEILSQHHITALPLIPQRRNPLLFKRFCAGDALQKGEFGIREPVAATETVIPDIVIVPLLAFDRLGNRLGYGAGYYDTTLAQLRALKPITAIGVAFSFQEQAYLPAAAHDQLLDVIVTDKEIILPRS